MARIEDRDGKMVKVNVGDYVSFKADYEMCGEVTKIQGTTLTIRTSGDEEEYYTESASRCWSE